MNKLNFAFVTNEDDIDIDKKELIEFVNNHINFGKPILIKIDNKEKK